MKSFFATAAIAAIAVADHEECDADGKCWYVKDADIKRDIERAVDDICDFFDDLREDNPEEMKQEAQRKIKRELE